MGQAISFNSAERILDEGILVVTTKSINFVGAGVVVTSVAGVATVTIAGSVSGVTVKDEGVSIGTGFTVLNVIGDSIVATDAGAGQANITSNAWAINGNTIGAEKYIGSNDNFNVAIYTNGLRRVTVLNGAAGAGFVGINRTTPGNMLDIETTTDLAANTGVLRLRNRGDGINDFTEAGILFNVSSGNNPDLGTVGRIYMKYNTTDEGTGRLTFMVKDPAGTLTNVYCIKGIPALGAGGVGMGIGTTEPTVKLHVVSTTEQMRLQYDASNYFKTVVSSTGQVKYTSIGSTGGHTFETNSAVYSGASYPMNIAVTSAKAVSYRDDFTGFGGIALNFNNNDAAVIPAVINAEKIGFFTGDGNISIVSASLNFSRKAINTNASDGETINAPCGRFLKDTTGTTYTLTNNLITANSIILLTYASAPGITGFETVVVAGAGSAVITFYTSGVAAAPTSNTYINFFILN